MIDNTQKLPFHEWLIIGLVVACLFFLTIINYLYDREVIQESHHVHQVKVIKKIEVSIQGAVAKPGVYTVSAGSTVKDLLKLAEPIKGADIHQLKLEGRLRNQQQIIVPDSFINIYLKGAVEEEGLIRVPKGTRLQDLGSYIELLPSADMKKMKKRKIKEGEVIYIPFQS